MPQIRPITDLRNTNQISELCHTLAEPIFITKNGYGDMVVMSIETYERRMAMLDMLQKLDEAESELAQGLKLHEAPAVFQALRKKHTHE